MNQLILAALIFAATYVCLIVFTNKRPVTVTIAAVIFVGLGLFGVIDYTIPEVLNAIDWNVLLMISGTMGLVAFFSESKMPQRIADLIILAMPNVRWAVVILAVFAALVSAFIDNVATVLMVVPVALVMTEKLKISPVLPIIAIAISANLQGAATLVGDTTSILLGSQLNLTFLDFFWYMGRPCLFFVVQLACFFTVLYLLAIFRSYTQKPEKMPLTEVTDLMPSVLLVAMIVLLIIASFIPTEQKLSITNGLICVALLLFALVYRMLRTKSLQPMKVLFEGFEFDTLVLLFGLFIVIGGIEQAGVIKAIGSFFASLRIGNFAMYTIIVWGSVLISAFVDNIPYIATMLPVIQILSDDLGMTSPVLFFGLLIGATLGGNITPIGASANIAAISMLRSREHKVSNAEFMKLSIPYTLIAVVTGYVLVWVIYGWGLGVAF